MNLDVALIDFLAPHGVLTTLRIVPKDPSGRVTIDRRRDIFPGYSNEHAADIGGTRIYNLKSCSIERIEAQLRAIELHPVDHVFSFQFEHMGIPLGLTRQGHGGHYNFVLSPGWRLRELWISDPYDKANEPIEHKKQFRHEVIWDPQRNTQLVEMDLRSGRGSFSFIVKGTASLVAQDRPSVQYVEARDITGSVNRLGHLGWGDDVADRVADEVVHLGNWIELKPNIAGIGINLNAVIQDSFNLFRRKARDKRAPRDLLRRQPLHSPNRKEGSREEFR